MGSIKNSFDPKIKPPNKLILSISLHVRYKEADKLAPKWQLQQGCRQSFLFGAKGPNLLIKTFVAQFKDFVIGSSFKLTCFKEISAGNIVLQSLPEYQ